MSHRNVTFGNRVAADVISEDEVIQEWGGSLIPYAVLIRRGETEADTPGEHLAKREAELGVVWPQALPGSRERPTAVRLWLSEETYPAHTWVLDFSPLDCERLHFRFFKLPLCGAL